MSDHGTVTSADGTAIGFERFGSGPPVVLVHGGTADRRRWLPVVEALGARFRLYAVDRRGRGLSGDGDGPYAVEREGEDVAAVVEAARAEAGTAAVHVVGHSYGAVCALEAALLAPSIGRMVLYEPPIPTPGHDIFPPGGQERLRAAAATGDPETILELFFREIIELPPSAIDAMRPTPMWAARLAAAHTLAREGDALEAYAVDDRHSTITAPTRLLIGTESPHYYRPAAEALLGVLPDAEMVELPGQAHLAIDQAPSLFVDAVRRFIDEG